MEGYEITPVQREYFNHSWSIEAIVPDGWGALLFNIMQDFREVEEIRLASIHPLPVQGGKNVIQNFSGKSIKRKMDGYRVNGCSTHCLMAVFVGNYTPAYRLRMLSLLLSRIFPVDVRFARFPILNPRRNKSQISPMIRLMERMLHSGGILYRKRNAANSTSVN